MNTKKYQNMEQAQLNQALLFACSYGDLNLVKYLLTDPELTNHADINYQKKNGINALMEACFGNKLEVVKYLLTSSDLKEHINVNYKSKGNQTSLMIASCFGHLAIVKYLLTSPDLKEYANLYDKDNLNNNSFIMAAKRNHFNISQFFLIDMNMTIDSETMNWLQGENDKKEVYHDVIKLISDRNLKKHLENNLTIKETHIPKIKI